MEHTTKLIPVIRWSIGTLSKSFKKYLNTIYDKEQHQVARENSITGHCANTPESTYTKLQNVYHGDSCNIIYRRNTTYFAYKIANTQYESAK